MPDPDTFVFSADGKSVFTSVGFGGGGFGNTLPSGIEVGASYSEVKEFAFYQWDLATGDLIRSFPTVPAAILSIPDSTRLLATTDWTSSGGSELYEWRLDTPESLVAYVCANLYVPAFTPEQREQFAIENEMSLCEAGNAAP